jgi:hypothetical protein
MANVVTQIKNVGDNSANSMQTSNPAPETLDASASIWNIEVGPDPPAHSSITKMSYLCPLW